MFTLEEISISQTEIFIYIQTGSRVILNRNMICNKFVFKGLSERQNGMLIRSLVKKEIITKKCEKYNIQVAVYQLRVRYWTQLRMKYITKYSIFLQNYLKFCERNPTFGSSRGIVQEQRWLRFTRFQIILKKDTALGCILHSYPNCIRWRILLLLLLHCYLCIIILSFYILLTCQLLVL